LLLLLLLALYVLTSWLHGVVGSCCWSFPVTLGQNWYVLLACGTGQIRLVNSQVNHLTSSSSRELLLLLQLLLVCILKPTRSGPQTAHTLPLLLSQRHLRHPITHTPS
jgi:hypothetical protein